MVEMKDVSMVYQSSQTEALYHVNVTINEGEFVFLVGPSGSGKTTITKLLTGEIQPTEGSIIVNGFDMGQLKKNKVPKMRRTIGVVFQDFRLIPHMNVYDNVAFAMRVVGAPEKNIQERVPKMLELVGLEGNEKRLPEEMSGGEQQRIGIARALVNNPRMIIADEPTGNLDPETTNDIMDLLREISAKGKTIFMATHNYNLILKYPSRIIKCDEGTVIDKTTSQQDYKTTR